MSDASPNLPNKTRTSGEITSTPKQLKPRFSLAVATGLGLGYLPKAPGTWGSLGGIAIVILPHVCDELIYSYVPRGSYAPIDEGVFALDRMSVHIALGFVIAIAGVFAAGVAGRFWKEKDPQKVVIDEVSGQYLTIFLGLILAHRGTLAVLYPSLAPVRFPLLHGVNWKYLLLGFILFRAFDIWKPFPARQAESLPGGLGIMADDWIAGIYAGLGMWVVRILDFHTGLHLGF